MRCLLKTTGGDVLEGHGPGPLISEKIRIFR